MDTAVWMLNSTMDSCFEERGGIFPCSSTITGNLVLMVFYGALLGVAAKFISDGAEMLLDFGLPASIIGGVVLPILGAVPDSAIIVASGLGKDAQEKLSVGMGTLAGSTVMLLTVAWAASLFVARCDLDKRGESIDVKMGKFSWTDQGMTLLPEIKSGIIIMLATSILYLVVQSADWYWGATRKGGQPVYVKHAALATMVLCILGLLSYIIFSIFDSKRNDRLEKLHKEEMLKRKALHAILTLTNRNMYMPVPSGDDGAEKSEHEKAEDDHAISKKYFKAWHIKKGIRSFQERQGSTEDERAAILDDDVEAAGSINDDDSGEEKEDSTAKAVATCIALLVGGVAMVTIFSDPMCDVLTALTDKKNKSYIPIPSFYVSFVVTPFCSNASELVSSLIFASKKTRENTTMTYSQLFGAATMNNTLCLGIFMGLVYFKDLEWIYGSEVICIMLCQWIVGLISFTKTYKVWMGVPVGVTYLICIILVYLLEYKAGWF